MKIVIAGSGKVGAVLAEQLSRVGHDIIVIDIEPENLAYVENTFDVMCMEGDAASPAVLQEAGITECDLLIAMTGSDEVNLLICLIAKKLGVDQTIARVRKPVYSDIIDLIKGDMSLSMAINPEYEAAVEIFRSLRFKSANQIESFANSKMEVLTCVVKPGSPICNCKVKDLYKTVNAKIFACGIKRGTEVFIPNGETEIKEYDTLSFVATPEDSYQFFKKMGYDVRKIDNLVIIGGGRLGYYLAKMCIENGIPVKIIDKNRSLCLQLDNLLPTADVICGNGTDISLLEEEDVLTAAAIATLTGSDETNSLISMYLTRMAPKSKIITKIKKSDFEDLIQNVDVGSVFYPKYITADHIQKYVCAMQNSINDEVQSLYHVIDNKVEVLEFLISDSVPNLGVPIQQLKLKSNLLLANITRKKVSFIPGGNDTVEAGDTLLVVTTRHDISRFTDIFA